jgi:hypothetical protein
LKEPDEVSEIARGHRPDESGENTVKGITDLERNESSIWTNYDRVERLFVALSQLRQLLFYEVLDRRAVDREKADNHNIDVAVNELVDPRQALVANHVPRRQFEFLVGKSARP